MKHIDDSDAITFENMSAAMDEYAKKHSKKFDPNEPRDEHGRWTTGGGSQLPTTFDISDYSENAKEITPEQRMRQADYLDIKTQMSNDLAGIRQGTAEHTEVNGNLSLTNARTISDNAWNEARTYSKYLAGDTVGRMHDFVTYMERTLSDPSLSHLDAKNIDDMMKDCVQKMVFQEVESNRQQFTDHGIRHVWGDIERQDRLAQAITGKPQTAEDRLMGAFIMVNHDIGYDTPLIRSGGLRGVMISGNHPLFSEKILSQQKDQWNENKIFSPEQYSRILDIVKTHASSDIDKQDILKTSSRLSDNLALFAGEKLPSMFAHVENGIPLLLQMSEAAEHKDEKTFNDLRTELYTQIHHAGFEPGLERDLQAATRELSLFSHKFTLGVLAGSISHIGRENNKAVIDIKYNETDHYLQQVFDMGQRQTKKMLEDYGETDFTKTEYDLGGIATLRVKGAPDK
jgi:hypothetical protein